MTVKIVKTRIQLKYDRENSEDPDSVKDMTVKIVKTQIQLKGTFLRVKN